jgi:hypothetical protein
MRATLSSQEFARKCFGLELPERQIASNPSQTPPILKQAKAEYAKLQ